VKWNQTRAAEILEIDRVTLHHKLKKYGWSRPTVEAR
jgi:DNA-binding protein Fis